MMRILGLPWLFVLCSTILSRTALPKFFEGQERKEIVSESRGSIQSFHPLANVFSSLTAI
jgi:hypothetical protein